MHTPSLPNTLVSDDGFEWRPATFCDCLIELEHIRTLIPEFLNPSNRPQKTNLAF